MSERTGKTLKTTTAGTATYDVVAYELADGGYEVERAGVILGKICKYESRTEVKAGKVRASERRRPVTRWMATPKFVAGAFKRSASGFRTAKDAVTALMD